MKLSMYIYTWIYENQVKGLSLLGLFGHVPWDLSKL